MGTKLVGDLEDQSSGDHLSMRTKFVGDHLFRGIDFTGIICPGGQEVGDQMRRSLFSIPTVHHLVNMDGVEPVTTILNMKRIWAKEDTVTSLSQGVELLIDLSLK